MARFPLRLSSTSPKRQRQQQLLQTVESVAASRSHGTPTRRRMSRSSTPTTTRDSIDHQQQQQQQHVENMAQRLDLKLGNLQESLSQKQKQLQTIQAVNRHDSVPRMRTDRPSTPTGWRHRVNDLAETMDLAESIDQARGNLHESLSQRQQQPPQLQAIDTWRSRPGTPSGKKSPQQEQQHMDDLAQSLGMTLGNLQHLLSQVQDQQQDSPKVDTIVRQRRDPPLANPNVDTGLVQQRRDPPGHGGRPRNATSTSNTQHQQPQLTVNQLLGQMQQINHQQHRFVRPDLVDDSPSFPFTPPPQQQRDDSWSSVKQAPAPKQRETPSWDNKWTPRREEIRAMPTETKTNVSFNTEWMLRKEEARTMPTETRAKTNVSFDSHSTTTPTTQNTSSVDTFDDVVQTPADTNPRVKQNNPPMEDRITDLPKYSPNRHLAQSAFARVSTMDSTSTAGTSVCPAETAQVRNMRHARLRDQSPLSLHRPTSPRRRHDNVGHYQPVASPRGRRAMRRSRASHQKLSSYSTSTTRPAVLLPKRIEEIPYHPKRSASPDPQAKPQANSLRPTTSKNRQVYSTPKSEVFKPEHPEEPPFYPKLRQVTRDETQDKVKADLVHPPRSSCPPQNTTIRPSSPMVSKYSAEMAYHPVQHNLNEDEIETFVELETIEDESLIHFQDKLVYGVEHKVEPKATCDDEESEGTADESEETVISEDADETIEETLPKSSGEATSAGTHASSFFDNDTFDRSVTNSFLGDWDPEKDISLFYEKYQKMGTFNVGAKVETEDKPPEPGFFEALGKAVDSVQVFVCSDATQSCRCEPPVELGPLRSRDAKPGKRVPTY